MLRISLVLLCLLTLSVPASAAVIISVQDANVVTNGTGFVDVLISSSSPDELLTLTGFEFQITGSPNGTGSLEFLHESNPANFSPPDYIFGAATGNYADNLLSSTSIYGSDSYQAGLTSVTLTGTPQTLVRLNLKHTAVGAPEAAVNSTFTIGLNPLGANDFSYWDNPNSMLAPLGINASSFANTGTITITSAAVPEPSTFAVLAMLGVGAIGRKLRQRKMLQTNLEPSSSQD